MTVRPDGRLMGGAVLAAAMWFSIAPASALCIYRGQLYAKTTLGQEFADAPLVVRGTVLSEKILAWPDSDEDFGVVDRVAIDRRFKGQAPRVLTFFTRRDSGGFYLDVGTQYLLFLRPAGNGDEAERVPHALVVNYNCGQSREWTAVPAADRRRLRAMAGQHGGSPGQAGR